MPLLIADLPVFVRWRGMPEFGDVFDELVDVVDRLIVDSTEWPDEQLAHGYGELAQRFDRTVVSDIAWERTERWRRELAGAWPFEAREISVKATRAQALLLAGWLRSRLGHDGRASSTSPRTSSRPSTSTVRRSRRRRASRRRRPSCCRTSSSASRATPIYEAAVRAAAE